MRSQAFSSPSKRGLVGLAVAGLVAALCLLLIPGAPDAAKGQSDPAANVAKKKKKKKDTVKVVSYNLYLGSDTDPARDVASCGAVGCEPGTGGPRTDGFADEVGKAFKNVSTNDFNVRARTIAEKIKKNKIDLVGLQEASLWKLEIPSDGGGPPRGSIATPIWTDYLDTLVDTLNEKAKSKKACGKAAKKRKAQGKKPKPCYRGYRLVGFQNEFNLEFPGDFDNDPGPNNRTCDISSGACGNPYPSGAGGDGSDDWISGNDDTPGSVGFPTNFGEPPAAECSDGIDNDGDGLVDWGPIPGTNETSGPTPGLFGGNPPAPGLPGWHCNTRLDDDESAIAAFPLGEPLGLPQDTNMDNHIYTGDAGAAPLGLPDALGNGLDPPGVHDCEAPEGFILPLDTNPEPGPSVGDTPPGAPPGTPPWDAPGFDGDQDPDTPGSQVPVCLLHGIDGDIRLEDRDALLARKGAGVKTRNVRGGNFGSTLTEELLGAQIPSTRGWVSADVSVRGKKFRLVNTHLEDEDRGTFREDQAAELVAPGGPATAKKTVLLGDFNSDPSTAPGADLDADGASDIAYSRLTAAGFRIVSQPSSTTWGHGELLNDLSDQANERLIDYILTNSPSIRLASSNVLDPVGGGLWASDHRGVLSRLKVPGGKKKK